MFRSNVITVPKFYRKTTTIDVIEAKKTRVAHKIDKEFYVLIS